KIWRGSPSVLGWLMFRVCRVKFRVNPGTRYAGRWKEGHEVLSKGWQKPSFVPVWRYYLLNTFFVFPSFQLNLDKSPSRPTMASPSQATLIAPPKNKSKSSAYSISTNVIGCVDPPVASREPLTTFLPSSL